MRSQFAKIALSAVLAFTALVPAAYGAVALPGQELLSEKETNPVAEQFGLPGQKMSSPTDPNWKLGALNAVIKRGLQVVAGVSVLMIVWAGYLYLTSYGEEEKVKKAKKAVLWTILGLVTGLGGWAVIDLVNSLSLNAK